MVKPFTKTQQKIVDVLIDGKPHPRSEILACIPDELACTNAMHQHLAKIRRIIKEQGRDIICQLLNKRCCYRMVIILAPSSKE